jgi:hypothetical protein
VKGVCEGSRKGSGTPCLNKSFFDAFRIQFSCSDPSSIVTVVVVVVVVAARAEGQ